MFGTQTIAETPSGTREPVRGQLLRIAGHFVQLPPDAYVNPEAAGPTCVPDLPCAGPTYRIVRGGSSASVSVTSGAILSEEIAPGEEGAFDFLRQVLR